MTVSRARDIAISDEHSVLLWHTCAYADDLSDAAAVGRRLTSARDAMVGFLHYRLLPYLTSEERQLQAGRLPDDPMLQLLVADHQRLRADVDAVASSRNHRLLALAATALVDRLDRHVRREESWLADHVGDHSRGEPQSWAQPLLCGDPVDVDALPVEHRDALVRQRLARLRPGDSVRLQASSDLHPLWRRQYAVDHGIHAWVYEEAGPTRWRARVTRRRAGD